MTPSRWTHTGYAQQLVFGPGAVQRLPEHRCAPSVLRRVLLVTTEGRAASDDGERVRAAHRPLAGVDVRRRAVARARCRVVQEAVRQARRDAVDAVVSFGGGSCADLGKAVCWFTEQEQGTPGAIYADRPVLPHVSIPTTYSGAELTPVLRHDRSRRPGQKSGAGGPTTAPLAAIYDPELTLSHAGAGERRDRA